eukprot:jgi/Mesvir1/19927/Mv13195-RA.1
MAGLGRGSLHAVRALVLVLSLVGLSLVSANLVNVDVSREIDLDGQLATVSIKLEVKNDDKKAAEQYLLSIPADLAAQLSYAEVSETDDSGEPVRELALAPASAPAGAPKNLTYFAIDLSPSPLASGASITLDVYLVYARIMQALPAEISQAEVQKMVYVGQAYFVSPYATKKQATKVVLPSPLVESFTKVEPVEQTDSGLSYGPYKDVAPFSFSTLRIHFENNRPFIYIDKLVREIEVSHWGNVYVEETYKMRHGGAKHKGTFSRLDYQRNPAANGAASFNGLRATLPGTVHSVYYRDGIGNISTSGLRMNPGADADLEIAPRFPLFGGWSTEFTLGYSLPLSSAVFHAPRGSPAGLVLNISLSSPFQDVSIQELELRIVLPEGASPVSHVVKHVIGQVAASRDVKYSYLDTSGRPVLVLRLANLVEDHNQPLLVYYDFSPLSLLKEPLLVTFALLLFFAACMAYVRCDFTISKGASYAAAQRKEALEGLRAQLTDLLRARGQLYSKMQVVLKEAAQGGADSLGVAEAKKKKMEEGFKTTLAQVKALAGEMERSSAPGAATVSLFIEFAWCRIYMVNSIN